uniref:Uncharacterized protein n=1 Tax=Arundo donax TaxID=35708 RepID=A0A0A9CMD9_ARUDO
MLFLNLNPSELRLKYLFSTRKEDKAIMKCTINLAGFSNKKN